jgi:two-component system LytT family response regulator
MKRIRVMVVEDEARQRARLSRLIEATTDFELVGEATNGADALSAIRTERPDLVLLDVQMPEMNGLEVLEALGPQDLPAVIFVTAYDQYALRAFELHALDYLLKPFDDERFERMLERARARIRHGQVEALGQQLLSLLTYLNLSPTPTESSLGEGVAPAPAEPHHMERFAIKIGGRMVLLKVAEVDWIAGAGVYVELHTGKKRYHLRETLSNLEARLDTSRFVRIHRSTIVNLDRIKELVPHFHGEYLVLLDDGTQLKLSRSYRDRLELILGSLG